MKPLLLLLAAVAVRHPAPSIPRPLQGRPASQSAAPRQAPGDSTPRTPFDSTIRVINDVAVAVADARAESDRFRTRAFNAPLGSVLESGAAFRSACERLVQVARTAPRRMCRACMRASQPAFDHYRAWLPSLASMGGRCATSLRTRVTEQSSPATLRQEAIDMSNLLLSTLGIYEQRVAEVRASLSGTPQPAPHRPGR